MNVTYTITPQGQTTRVFAFINISMNNGFGGINQTDLTQGKAGRDIQTFLDQVKTTIESHRQRS
jgi:hypothetical protein